MIFVFDPRNARMENRSGFKFRQFLMLFFVLGGPYSSRCLYRCSGRGIDPAVGAVTTDDHSKLKSSLIEAVGCIRYQSG